MKHSLPSTTHSFGPLPALPWWERRRWQVVALLLTVLLLLGIRTQAAVIITVGNGQADYSTITQALAAIPSPLTQAYEVQLLSGSYSENVLINKTGTATNTLTIKPATGVTPIINGTFTFGAGSAYVTLSGNNGSTRALTLRQNSQLAPTLVFSDDATHNTASEILVRGAASSFTSGVVVIGDGASAGNDYNTLTQSWVYNANPSQLPANLVYAANAAGGANDAFTLTRNELFNFTRTGVLVSGGNGDGWNISNNSIYYNASATPTSAQTGIDFGPGSGANDALVSNNAIGGQAAGATGGTWVNAGTQNFRGIVMSCGSSTSLTNEVMGNTVSNVSLTGTSSAALTAFGVDAGRNELSGNTVSGVSNTGTSGVNSLVSRATTVLGSFTVSSGQLMVVENGLTVVQGNLTNAGILNHTGGDMLITGNFVNSGTFAQTLGDIEIKGNMTNTGQFTCSTGKVKLTGNGPQTVSGGLYFNLEVNGTGTKTLTNNATIYNGVQMLAGVLATGRYALTLDRLANLSETDASYVLGRVEVNRTPSAGTVEDFGGVGLEMLPAANSTLPGSTFVTRITGTAPVGAGGRQGILRYFDIDADVLTGLDLALTLRYLDHELNGISRANLRFFKSSNGGVTWVNKGVSSAGAGSPAGTGYAVLDRVDGFSRWTLGDINAPLPVGLTAFQAVREGQNAVLTWATATEQDNRGFGIEVSTDGQNFREIGFVAAEAGNSSTARHYRFVDASAGKAGLRYYRLRQDDRTPGEAHYFGPQKLVFEAAAPTFAAYPTQFGSDLTVALAHPTATTATLRLLDGLGREVWRQEVAPGAAPQQVQPVAPAGAYTLTATVAGQVMRQRVVKN
ncbi:hypothetical protein [Hymenobacter properus]|uniref:T9SS type A sorting domain-containing protein n=1 Tax=Hymenobacter properus TaxID=2791026 RepID=A0A931FMH6_9BACT|nr:hypothetical protein [Hymenobacter properus]MBF9143116.1 hypothetical protein [Hymenobacter properus]MBR7721924.1 hypothetical protein [Microvirga sp. SRT04]